ncbi:MAG: 4-oxalocrotonate tautomerase family protein [Bacteroidales bacterium]|jgi:4-oxalocrotonate tautomerase|nr:4-oxalocrotonate tautomerase family protein [Bacteroidales bacterium]
MPIINIKIAKGHSEEKKQKIVNEFTKIMVEALNIQPEWISILIDEYEHENWATGGTLHSIKFGKDWNGTISDLPE